jgi:threonine dehydratase
LRETKKPFRLEANKNEIAYIIFWVSIEFMASFFSAWKRDSKRPTTVSLAEIIAARDRIRPILPITPLTHSPAVSELVGHDIYFKWDNKFKTGSFKERGACNFVESLTDQERKRGVCAASAGNHALALSHHSARVGIGCTIVMPVSAPLVKVDATQRSGANVVLYGNGFDEAYDHALNLAKEHNLVYAPAFDDAAIICGQGTAGLEIMDQVGDIDSVIVPVGGGGLISGIATAIKATHPDIFILGVQSAWAVRGRQGEFLKSDAFLPTTIADGIAVKRPGKITAPIIESKVDKLCQLEEQEIARSIITFLELERTVIEGAGAAGLGGLLTGHLPSTCKRTVVMACGSNIDTNVLSRLIERDMGERGRLLHISVSVPDRPGSLNTLTGIIARCGANVLEVIHDRAFSFIPGNVDIIFLLEVKGGQHKVEVMASLTNSGIRAKEIL